MPVCPGLALGAHSRCVRLPSLFIIVSLRSPSAHIARSLFTISSLLSHPLGPSRLRLSPRLRIRRRRRSNSSNSKSIAKSIVTLSTATMPKSNFATFLIVCPTSFFLGIIFTNWTYDHHTLWTSVLPSDAMLATIESHYTLLFASPPILQRVFHAVVATGLLGFLAKLWRASESNMLFDGASLVLYMIGLVMYATNVVKGLRTIDSGEYGDEVPRVDTLRVMAASQVILALVLVGVLVLQSGQWYAESKEGEEVAEIEEEEKKAAAQAQAEALAAAQAGEGRRSKKRN
ncbi:ER membrane protein SH3-domain-containing protein [Geopyxis carbonaria]|nr:ER membrane protein SH3-domain-containing protein [Geopyxis carbonaria]